MTYEQAVARAMLNAQQSLFKQHWHRSYWGTFAERVNALKRLRVRAGLVPRC